MPDIEKIMQLSNEGFSNKEIAGKVGTEEEPITYQAISKLIKENTPAEPIEAEFMDDNEGHIKTFTAEAYGEYSEANGRTKDGGIKGKTVKATKEMLRAYITSGWTPNMLKEKWQMSDFQLVTLVHELAKAELRERTPVVNFKQDFFRF